MLNTTTDYLIVGGGPSGSAAAITLLRHEPEARVIMVESGNYTKNKPGESLHASAMPLLNQLGIAENFLKQNFLPSQGYRSYWEDAKGQEDHHLFSTKGSGWHLDRAKFDEYMAQRAVQAGCELRLHSRLVGNITSTDQNHIVSIQPNEGESYQITANKLIDATGRKALVARRLGAHSHTIDDLCAVQAIFEGEQSTDHFVQIEAAEEGWWYSAILPDKRVVVAFFTSTENIKSLDLRAKLNFLCQLMQTEQTWLRVKMLSLVGEPNIYSTMSQQLDQPSGKGWVATGDAACAFDPLSGQGMVTALRTGIFSAYCLLEQKKNVELANKKYNQVIEKMFESYRNQHILYYAEVQRWPDASFWKNRAGKLTISPFSIIYAVTQQNKTPHTICPWLPEKAIDLLVELMAQKMSAAELLQKFQIKTNHNYGDRRVLIALEWLLDQKLAKTITNFSFESTLSNS